MMDNDPNITSIKEIFNRKSGTIRFGHSLRSLREANNGVYRDVIDRLDTITSKDEFLVVISFIIQACWVEKARNKIMVIPNDDDCAILLGDIERFGISSVSAILQLLSVLYYPKSDEISE